ncbi:MAG: FAD-dependent oxidoreductase, partial [Rhodospirillaceae bacterium]|nr:FAD-dependent oxidoreductase [Rhodospirillaceae bacterium]
IGDFTQLNFATTVMGWLDDEDANTDNIDLASRYAGWALHTDAGKARHTDDILFRAPEKTDPLHLVETDHVSDHGVDMLCLDADKQIPRDGFALTDHGCDLTGALDQANYCVICHDRGKDSCSKGIRDKQTSAITSNDHGVPLAGCPLEEKISEMHKAKTDGHAVAALAIIAVDNPLCAGTGHRICNDCMKACIYQKQEPVDIPQVETRTLKDILELPWGFEIYSLLTRWNPLNIHRPLPKPDTGYKVLVVGQGPSGFSLAHHLMNEGHTIVAIDGAKIEPLDPDRNGITQAGERVPFQPVYAIDDVRDPLDKRVMAGFGGVAEYGITVRWDKNNLKIIRMMLERRNKYTLYGGIRFGGAITIDSAFDMGFDHVALCIGAGKPTVLGIPNGLARGVRQASDFLMALQLTGAAKMDSVANLALQLPVVVVGGGLTAIDTATEALAYYVNQVEKFLYRYETMQEMEVFQSAWTDEETKSAEIYLEHGRAIRDEREAARTEGREPDFSPLLTSWGGATIAYRRRMIDSPSYTLNHEEITKAFEQGIRFAELLSPVAVDIDDTGHADGIRLERQEIDEDGRLTATGSVVTLPARAILIAAGTQPNTVLARETPGSIEMDGKYFQATDEDGNPVSPEHSSKPENPQVTMQVRDDGRAVTFFGDLHPSFAGNVVKAFGSAKQGYPVINRLLAKREPSSVSSSDLVGSLDNGMRARVVDVIRLTENVVEVILHAPLAAQTFQPGQFFRMQNFEVNAKRCRATSLGMEGQALTGAWVDKEKGLVATIVMEMGGSSSLCSLLEKDEHVILMGPTGTPTEIPSDETVLLVGGGLGNAVLFSIGQAMRKAGSKVLYFAAYKTSDRYHTENIEAAADTVVWCCDEAPAFEVGRDGDKAFVGNVVEAMQAYANGDLGDTPIPMKDADRVIVIGSDMMMKAVNDARHGSLEEHLKPGHVAIGSINSPMQCMMKEICAQCLQLHKNPETGEETIIFSCFNQDQTLDDVVFPSLSQRLRQNAVQEKLTSQWILQ